MSEWSEELVLAWVELLELELEVKAALRTVFEDEGDIDGEDAPCFWRRPWHAPPSSSAPRRRPGRGRP
jgi:hypothetical protein